jgi:MADS-box transcription factor
MLDRHFRVFNNAEASMKSDGVSRSQSLDVPGVSRPKPPSPPSMPQRANSGMLPKNRSALVSSIPDTTFTPPSRSNSLRVGGSSRPRLKVQIPEEPSDGGSATAESGSPRGTSTDAASRSTRRHASESHSSGVVLPPPSPSASAILSAGASGPPNPFARPPPQQHQQQPTSMDISTPASALPSRFLNNEFLPSPSSFYPEWNFRGNDSNTLPSPLNFATPVVGTGPSFLRDDHTPNKRKSPDMSAGAPREPADSHHEPKRLKVE